MKNVVDKPGNWGLPELIISKCFVTDCEDCAEKYTNRVTGHIIRCRCTCHATIVDDGDKRIGIPQHASQSWVEAA